MKNIVFIAPPASGKGTQSNLLVSKYNYEHISTGDLLRDEAMLKTELGNQINTLMNNGQLLDDELVDKLIEKKLSAIKTPFILDGYPRTVTQAKMLDDMLKILNKTVDLAIYLNVSESESTRRMLGRLICPKCSRTYQKYDIETKPKEDNTCDYCNINLTTRSDDTEDSFKIRYKVYLENTKPLLDYYRKKGILTIINNTNTPLETLSEIEKVIK